MIFKVIDKKTGDEADTYKIALQETWARPLVYCDIEGFLSVKMAHSFLLMNVGIWFIAPMIGLR